MCTCMCVDAHGVRDVGMCTCAHGVCVVCVKGFVSVCACARCAVKGSTVGNSILSCPVVCCPLLSCPVLWLFLGSVV